MMAGPDFNSDRELGQGKVKWAVQNATKNLRHSIKTSAGELKLDDKGRCLISDPTLANEIRQEYRKDMAVSRVFTNHPSDRGHKYFFGNMPEMPWKRTEREAAEATEAKAKEEKKADEQNKD